MKLLHKLLILVLSLSVIPLGVVGWQSLDGLQKEIDIDLQALFKEKVSNNSRLIELQMDNLVKKVVEAVHFRKLGSMSKEEMGEFSKDLLRQFEECRIVTVLDDIGEEILTASSKGKVSPLDLNAHMNTLQAEDLERVASDNARFSKIYFRQEPRITLYTRFKFDDRPAEGTVAIGVSLASVHHLIQEIDFSKSQDGRILLFDRHGHLIAGKSSEQTFDDLKQLEQLPYVLKAFEQREKVPSSTGLFIDLEQKENIGAHAFLSPNIGWMLLISEPKEEVFASANLLFDRTLGMIIVTIFISLIAGLFTARKIVKPVKALVKGAKEIGQGNLEYRIPRLSSDEIGMLCDSFTDMGENLLNREKTISRIRGISAEINSLFDKKTVLEVGSNALVELIPDMELELWIHHQGQWAKLDGRSAGLVGEAADNWAELQEAQLVEGPPQQLLVPLGKMDQKTGWDCKGMMIMRRKEFSILDQQVAQILAGSIAVSMVNIEFLQESVDNERRAHELEIAELVQKTLYPDSDPEVPQIDFGSFLVSSSETGGDWFGYIESADKRRLSVLIGDVTGHGAPAALITAATNAFFKTVEHMALGAADQEFPIDLHDPIFLLKLLNRVILETARGRLVMTFFISTIDMKTGEMIYANAGHNSPWILRADPEKEITFDDLPAKVPTGGGKVKREGGKLKIKVGSKKTAPSAEAEEAAPKKKIKIRMGKKKDDEADSTATNEDNAAASLTESQSPVDAPKKKIKIRMGKKKSDETDTAEAKVNSPEETNVESKLPSSVDAPKKKIKIRMGKKKGDEADSPADTAAPAQGDAEAPAKSSGKKMKIKIGGKSKLGKKVNPWENVNARGMRLGEVQDATFDCRRTRLFKGDMMVWYTDGWVENTNPLMEEFGKKRCQTILEKHKDLEPAAIIEKLREASWEFYDVLPREDDVTIVIGKIKEDW